MIVLAYCAALRLGELGHLTVGDVDVPSGLLTVRNTKFFKSRRLPLDPSTIQALEDYLADRRLAGGPTHPEAPLFWHEARQGGYSRAAVAGLLVRALRAAGLKPARGKVGPRVHDLRHAFVVHRLLKWYEDLSLIHISCNCDHHLRFRVKRRCCSTFDRDYSVAHPETGTTTQESSMTSLKSLDLTVRCV